MIRYPYTLEMWYEEDATQDRETGAWIEGAHEWRVVGKCNVRQNGQANEVRGQDGNAFMYTYEVIMPSNTPPIAFGTPVRAYDRNGINIFDYKPRNDEKPDNGSSVTYKVQGYYKSGQPNQDVTVWL